MASQIGQFLETSKIYQSCFNQIVATEGQDRTNLFKQCETTYQQLKVQGKELTKTFASSSPEQQQRFSNVIKDLKELHRRQKALPTAQFLETFAAYQGYLRQLEVVEAPHRTDLFDRCEAIYQKLKTQSKEITRIVSNFSVKQQQHFSNTITDLKALHKEQKALKPAESPLPNLVLEEKWGDVRNTLLAEAARGMIPDLANYSSLEIAFLLLMKTTDLKRCEEYKTHIKSLIAAGHKSTLALEMAVIENSTEFVQSLLKAGVVPTEEIVSLAFLGYDSSRYARRLLTQAGLVGKKDHFYKNYSNKTPEDLLKSFIQDSSEKPKNLVHCIQQTMPVEIGNTELFQISLLRLAADAGVQFTDDNLNKSILNRRLDQVELMIAHGVNPTNDSLCEAIYLKSAAIVICILNTNKVILTEEHVEMAIEVGLEDTTKGEIIKALIRAGAPLSHANYVKACQRNIFGEDVLSALKPDAVDLT